MDEPLDKSPSTPHKREDLDASLKKLKLLINALPSTVPEGPPDGKIVKYFTDVEVDEDEGPYYSVDRAWTRTFQGLSDEEQQQLITRGRYGVTCIYKFLCDFAQKPGIEKYDGLHLMTVRVDALVALTARV